jgi:hypothetical protein
MNTSLAVLHVSRASFSSLSDAAFSDSWNTPASGILSYAGGNPALTHLHTEIRSFWSPEFLFVLFSASYARLRLAPKGYPTESSGKTMKLWEISDVLECFVGTNTAATLRYKEFQVAPDGRWIDIAIDRKTNPDSGDMAWISGGQFVSFLDETKHVWRVAMQIPWTSMETTPSPDIPLDCNFYRATGTFHGDELLAWSPTGYGPNCFHRVETFGKMFLVV